MKFLVDVNIPLPLIQYLRQAGYEVQDATIDFPKAKDITLIKNAQTFGQIIITKDKDFLELINHKPHKVPLVFISLYNQKTNNIVSHFAVLLKDQPSEVLETSVTVIEEDKANSVPIK